MSLIRVDHKRRISINTSMEDSSACKPTENFEIDYITIRMTCSKMLSKYAYIGHFHEPY